MLADRRFVVTEPLEFVAVCPCSVSAVYFDLFHTQLMLTSLLRTWLNSLLLFSSLLQRTSDVACVKAPVNASLDGDLGSDGFFPLVCKLSSRLMGFP